MLKRVKSAINPSAIIFLLGAAFILGNLGLYGLFDPWEMNRTHISRKMASAPSILVVEKEGTDAFSRNLTEILGSDFSIESKTYSTAKELLASKVFSSVVVDFNESTAAAHSVEMKELASFLLSVSAKNRSTQFVIVKEDAVETPEEILESVRNAIISLFSERLKDKSPEDVSEETVIDVEEEVATVLANLEEPVTHYEDLVRLLKGRSLPNFFTAGFKSQGETLHVPVLEPLLTALFFKVLGFSEFSARLTPALFGLLMLFMTFFFTRRLFGTETGNLTSFLLLTMPIFLTFSKLATGGTAYMAALTLSSFSFILIVRGESLNFMHLASAITGAIFGYLSMGLTGLFIIALIPLAYMLSLFDFRRHVVIGVASLCGVFLLLIPPTLLVDEYTFFSQFKFMASTFAGGIPADQKGFEFFIRQIGFGLFPWIIVTPFAIAALISAQANEEERRLNLFLTLWALLPFGVLTAMLFHYNHYIYPSAPAVAVVCALFLSRTDNPAFYGRGAAFAGILIFAVIAKDIFTSPEPLYALFAFDPPFSKTRGDLRFPDVIKVHTAGKLALLFFVLIFVYYNSRISSFLKSLPSRLRKRRGFITGLIVIAAIYLLNVTISLALKWSYLFRIRGGDVVEHLTPGAILLRTFLTAPETLIIYLLAVLFILNRLLASEGKLGSKLGIHRILNTINPGYLFDFFEKHHVFRASLCVLALVFAGYHVFVLNAQTSFHFSQKHIIETYKTENDSQPGSIYKHLFSANGIEDKNFYTAQIPEINSREEVIRKLLHSERSFFILPKNSFSDVNHSFRQKSQGKHIPVLDARSSRFILVSNSQGSQPERNWLKAATTTKEAVDGIKGFKRSFVNFEDRIHLLGYTIESDRVRRGSKNLIKLYFESQGGVGTSYRIFMHIDHQRGGNRIHGDHWPVNLVKEGEEENNCVGCFATTHWLKGDVVIDTYEIEIPIGSPSGAYDMWVGFYNPSDEKRVKVKDFDRSTVRHDGQNRVRIGTLIVD